jgi:hypothetical protein
MSSTKSTSSSTKVAPKDDVDPKLASIKSYWYPERAGNLEEVKVGYQLWQSRKHIIFMSLIPVAVAILMAFIVGLNHSEEFLQVFRMISNEWQTRAK